MRAGLRVLQEDAKFFRDFRAQAVLDLASIVVQQVLRDIEHLEKQAFRKPVAADDFTGALFTLAGEAGLVDFGFVTKGKR